MDNNARRMWPEILFFYISISLFSKFATVEMGQKSLTYEVFRLETLWIIALQQSVDRQIYKVINIGLLNLSTAF